MMRWLVVLGLVWGLWIRDGGDGWGRSGQTASPVAAPAGDVQTMDGCDPFPPH